MSDGLSQKQVRYSRTERNAWRLQVLTCQVDREHFCMDGLGASRSRPQVDEEVQELSTPADKKLLGWGTNDWKEVICIETNVWVIEYSLRYNKVYQKQEKRLIIEDNRRAHS